MEREIEVIKHPDGSFALCNAAGNEYDPASGLNPNVWATVRIDGKEYFCMIPATHEQLKSAPEMVEQMLIRVAQHHPF